MVNSRPTTAVHWVCLVSHQSRLNRLIYGKQAFVFRDRRILLTSGIRHEISDKKLRFGIVICHFCFIYFCVCLSSLFYL